MIYMQMLSIHCTYTYKTVVRLSVIQYVCPCCRPCPKGTFTAKLQVNHALFIEVP